MNLQNGQVAAGMESEAVRLCFCINLHNFLILYALCKETTPHLPKGELAWLNFKRDRAIKVGSHTFTPGELEHAFLRAPMSRLQLSLPYNATKQYFLKLTANDPRIPLANLKKDPLLNFALYLPTKYAPLALITLGRRLRCAFIIHRRSGCNSRMSRVDTSAVP